MIGLGTTSSFPSAGSVTGYDVLTKGWGEYKKRLFQYAFRQIHNQQAAEDAVVETFFRAQRAIMNDECRAMDLEGEPREKKFCSWIFRITRNVCTDYLRQSRAISIDDVNEPVYSSESRQILSLAVRQALDQLRPQYAEVVRLCDLEELSAKEGAQIAGLSVPAFKSRLYRGREAFKKLFSGTVATSPTTRRSNTVRVAERNGFFTYAECPLAGAEDFVKAHFRAHQTARNARISLGRKLRLVLSQNTAGPELREACHRTIRNMLKQVHRTDQAGFWCGLFDRHVAGTEDPAWVSAKSNRCSRAESRNGQVSLPASWVVPNAVRPAPPTSPAMHPDTLRLPEPDLSKWNEEPRSTPLRTRLVKPSPVPVKRAKVIAKPTPKAKQIDCKKKTPLPFIGEKGFVSTVEVLCKRLVDESKGWLDLEEITAEFKVARRYARNRQPLSDPTRSAIIDLIYACCSNSDAKAMRWVRVMTAEFPPRPGTPEYLLPPPQTKSKSGR